MDAKKFLKKLSASPLIKAEKLSLIENRKKIYFVLKVIFFVLLVIAYSNFQTIGAPLGIEPYHLGAIIYFALGNILITTLRLILVNVYIKRNRLKNDYKDNFILGVDRIASLLSYLLFIVAFFYFFRINPKEFLTSISLVAVALVLLFKDYISNLISGMIMMFSDQFHLNDYVKYGEFKGRIIDINLANFQIKNDEGEIIYIPNNVVYSKDIINYSKNASSTVVVDFVIHINFFGVIQQLEAYIIQKLTKQFNSHVKGENVILKIEHVKKEEAIIKLVVSLNKQNKRLERIIHRACNFFIVEFLHQEMLNSGRPAADTTNQEVS